MKIDFSKVITAAQTAQDQAKARAGEIKQLCKQEIHNVLDAETQASLCAAALTGALSPEDQAAFAASQHWIEAMKAEARRAAQAADAPSWPEAAPEIIALARRF